VISSDFVLPTFEYFNYLAVVTPVFQF